MGRFEPQTWTRRKPDPELGPAVRARRRQLGWSQKRLAREAELSEIMVRFIETGRRAPSYMALRRLGHVLGLQLVEPLPEPPPPAPLPPARPVASVVQPDRPTLPRSPTTLRPGAVIAGRSVAFWLAYDRAARAAAEPLPRRPAGPPFTGR